MHAFLRHVLLRQHGGQLAGAVVAEIVEDDGIAFLDPGQRGAGSVGHDDGLDKLVGHVGVVGGLDAFRSGGERRTLPFDQQVVRFLDAVPALVAVHGVETAADRGDAAGGFGHLLLQFGDEALAAARVGVAAVHEGVNEDLVEPLLRSHAEELIHVVEGGVHATVGGQAHQVKFLPAGFHVVENGGNLRVLQQFVLAACDVDLNQVLVHHAAGTQVHVPHFGVAHLPVGQADVFAASLQVAHRIVCPQGVDVRRTLGPDGVGIVVAAFSPAVENHQEDFFIHIFRIFVIL